MSDYFRYLTALTPLKDYNQKPTLKKAEKAKTTFSAPLRRTIPEIRIIYYGTSDTMPKLHCPEREKAHGYCHAHYGRTHTT